MLSVLVEVRLSLNIAFPALANVASLLNSMALLIALSGSWLLLATRWRRQFAGHTGQLAGSRTTTGRSSNGTATQRIDRFFYGFGLGSLGLAGLLSSLTRLV
jgi:hypothetical protein